MLKDTLELAENKLLLLYIISKVDEPVSRSGITQIVLENNLLNYFQMQQYISELIEGGFTNDTKENNRHMISITKKGTDTLSFFNNRIPDKKRGIIDTYLNEHNITDKKDTEALSSYAKTPEDKYIVNLRLIKNEDLLIELNLVSETLEQAEKICDNFEKHPEDIYNKITNLLS